jgi:hypothetical protein
LSTHPRLGLPSSLFPSGFIVWDCEGGDCGLLSSVTRCYIVWYMFTEFPPKWRKRYIGPHHVIPRRQYSPVL